MSKSTINEKEAFQIIETFNFLNASRAPMTSFLHIIDCEQFEIRLRGSDILFKGIAGFADHQIGKLIYFDQAFECELLRSRIENNQITVETKGAWHARTWQSPAAYSQQLIADMTHTWILAKKTDDAPLVIISHVCESFAYRPGYSPEDDVVRDFHLTLK